MKNIAILGSSGGNLFNLGGKDPFKLLEEIFNQCKSTDINVSAVQFIGAEVSMDNAKASSKASLFVLNDQKVEIVYKGTLKETNEAALQEDDKIANEIKNGHIDGLIIMSIDPKNTNKLAIQAAVEKKIPIVGTGGTAMATVSSDGGNVISTSGTTGTTNRTRAISFVSSLAKHWKMNFRPAFTSSAGNTVERSSSNPFKRINIKGIMTSSLPAFISLALILALSQIPIFEGLGDVFDIIIGALPVVLAVVAAKQVSDLDEVSIVAGVIAGVLSVEGGIIGGIIAGIMAGLLVEFLFIKFIQLKFPMTTVNIFAAGLSGIISGLIVYYLLGPIALSAGEFIKFAIEQAINFNSVLAGMLAGLLIWPAILGGVYHAAILPIVLFEMERAGVSFLGAIDMVALVMVAAGINLANILFPKQKDAIPVATSGFLINLGFGTFVESAYPFMFSNKIIFGGAIFSAGLGGALVGFFNVRGTAYVPTFVAPFASTNLMGLIIAMVVTLTSAFIITVIANKLLFKK
ncbi:PTS sugar transporter [Oceanobacillus sp. CFH 90083]|uniref:PTS sugar transporter n=1 Tax=Oceanobacillus sp. CFH 90083 TaxID=2592336 RepID=UPI00128D545A|nr:PTS sugar transporter [Oceanobacillus sp. CFH 90083]